MSDTTERLFVARYTHRQYDQAVDRARDNVGDGTNVTHVVEVFDEGTVRDPQEGVDIGVLYVVADDHVDGFIQQHEGEAEVQETFGYRPDEESVMPQPRQDADGQPFVSYYRNDEHLSFCWSGLPDQPVEVSAGGAGEPVVATIDPPKIPSTFALPEILAHFRLVCDLFAERAAVTS